MIEKYTAIRTGLLLACLAAGPANADLLDKSLKFADDLWNKSQDVADDAWRGTQELFRGAENDDFARVWDELLPKLNEALSLDEKQDELPENVWFGEDQESVQNDINGLLDEAIDILAIAPAQSYRNRIRELEASIRETREEIAEYRQRRVAAPKDAVWEKTAGDYQQAIREAEARIQVYQAELTRIRGEFAEELQRIGLQISDEQLEFLLSTVVGDDLIEMGVAFDNVKTITIQLEQLMVESKEDLASARRYYGMYLILLKTLERMQRHLLDAVEMRYLAEIDAIIAKTRELMQQTRSLMRNDQTNRETLAANIEAQELTLRSAALYRDYLIDQASDVAVARDQLLRDIAIADNTYETVKVSGELVRLMKSSQQLLDTLLKRQVPALRTFQNLQMKREFEKLTLQLQQDGSS